LVVVPPLVVLPHAAIIINAAPTSARTLNCERAMFRAPFKELSQ
jgi:hypothetical protein